METEDLAAVRTFIERLLAEHDDRAPFEDDESLIKTGRLDSFAVVKLVMFLESDFAVDFTRVEFDPERFDSVSRIAAMIEHSRRLA